VREHNKLGVLGEERVELVEPQAAVIFHVQNPQSAIGTLRGQLPGHETRVVLRHGEDDLVSCAKVCATPGRSNKIDGFRCPAGPNNFVRSARVQEFRNYTPSVFIEGCGLTSECVESFDGFAFSCK